MQISLPATKYCYTISLFYYIFFSLVHGNAFLYHSITLLQNRTAKNASNYFSSIIKQLF